MPLYKRQADIDEDIKDQIEQDDKQENFEQPVVVDDSGNWKKRYGDLRSYSQKKENELAARIKALEDSITNQAKQAALPKSKEEVESWAKKFPDVYAMIKSMINIDLIDATESVNQRFKSIEEKEREVIKERAINAIVAAHPDFHTLETDDTFREWITSKSKRIQDALFENNDDAQAAIEVLNLFKLETGRVNKKVDKANPRDAAREIKTPSVRKPVAGSSEYDFSESQINAMSIREYEHNEKAIEEARRNGRIAYDITGAAQ
jgi:hypothetical protein